MKEAEASETLGEIMSNRSFRETIEADTVRAIGV